MRSISAKRERGAALLALLAAIMLAASWFLVSQLNAESGGRAAVNNARNAEVLNRAKQALIGYVAMQAANSGEDNPGALPCPEAAGYFDNATDEGKTAPSCTLPKVGRFPWRTIGTEKLLDSAGEPLWYVVSPGWAYTSGNTNINSNSIGQLTVDGAATTPVASPGNVNFTAHGFTAGNAVSFTTGGTLPTGITAGTTYYVIAAGLTANAFRIATVPAGPAINFTGTSSGSHNVHRSPLGTANSVVALIIAPGPAFSVPACGAIPAKVQQRPIVDPVDGNPFPDLRNYLECENATAPTPDATFVTSGPSGSFNDQVVRITVADIMPGIEAAVAKRIERDIVPALKGVYASALWGAGISAANPLFPYPAPFSDPGTSNFQGAAVTIAGAPQGLLPFNQVNCTADASNPRCLPGAALTSWASAATAYDAGGWGNIQTQSCSYEAGNAARVCEGEYLENSSYPGIPPYTDMTVSGNRGMRIEMQVTLRNIAMGLRAFDPLRMQIEARNDGTTAWLAQPVSYVVTMNSDGSATIRFWADLPNIDSMAWGTWAQYRIRIERLVVTDHALLNSAAATTGWFVRNEWYRLLYYAIAQGHAAAQLPNTSAAPCDSTLVANCACTSTTLLNCLTVTNLTPSNNKKAIMILAGRSNAGATRPNATLSDYLEFANADLNTTFEKQPISKANNAAAKQPFNDRVIVLDSN